MNSDTLMERADLLLEQGRYHDAENHLRKVLEQEPQNDQALAMLSRCYINNKDIEKGIETIYQAIALNPNESFYFYLLGFAEYQRDLNLAAISNLKKAIEINPYVAEYFGMLAFVTIEEKEFEQALDYATQGLAVESDNITCLNARSMALNKLKRTSEAVNTMQTALAQDPDNETTHSTIGLNFLERGRHKEARGHFMEALRIDPAHSAAKIGLKEALKSKLLLYKWLLQYSFWVNNKGRFFQVGLPIALYICFRVMISISRSGNSSSLTWILIAIYLFIVVVSWTIGSIANFVLLFHPLGRHALINTEKWSAINSVTAFFTGIIMLVFSITIPSLETIMLLGLISLSLALPLSNIDYPIRIKGKSWRESYAVFLSAIGILAMMVFISVPAYAAPLLVVYGIGFLIYNWMGLAM